MNGYTTFESDRGCESQIAVDAADEGALSAFGRRRKTTYEDDSASCTLARVITG